MRRNWSLVVGLAAVGLMTLTVSAGGLWEDDFQKASETAKAQNRFMLLDFSGSDWCGWCIKLDKEVFSKSEFKKYAKENLVCVLLDFPRRKSLGKKQQEQNKELAGKFGVRGYPTVIILSPDGEQVAQTGYKEGGPEAYVEHLESFISKYREEHNIAAPQPAGAGRSSRSGTRKTGAKAADEKAAEEKPAAGEKDEKQEE